MNYQPRRKSLGGVGIAIVMGVAALLLPMGPAVQPGGNQVHAEEEPETQPKRPYPEIVKTVPEIGATDVPANLKEISVTFDRDMGKGMSWTGGKPFFPPIDPGKKGRWVDQRTCVLPVKLKRGEFYRVGINSQDYRNFKSGTGVPTPSSVICFVTEGAKPEVKERVRVPKIVKLDPPDGAIDVDPAIQSISVTFDIQMAAGMSWTGGGEAFPKSKPGTQPIWSADGKTCSFPVALESGRQYRLGLNSLSYNNFQSKSGVPLEAGGYSFKTK